MDQICERPAAGDAADLSKTTSVLSTVQQGQDAPNLEISQAKIDWIRRDSIAECGALIVSLGISLEEAAWRGSDATAETTLRQIRKVLIQAIEIFKEIGMPSDAGGWQQ
jgi:hypothetical protein